MEYGNVIKKSDDLFVVLVDLTDVYSGYGVVPREKDPQNKYDIDDVRAWCEANPDKVYTEHPLAPLIDLSSEKEMLQEWLKSQDYIGVKIATGRATIDEYAPIIEGMKKASSRINEIDKEIAALRASVETPEQQ